MLIGFRAPPRIVGSLARITHSTPDTTPMPVTTEAPTGNSVCAAAVTEKLEEGRVGVDEQLDALPGQHLAALPVPLDVARTAARRRLGDEAFELGQPVGHGRRVVLPRLGPPVDRRPQHRHDAIAAGGGSRRSTMRARRSTSVARLACDGSGTSRPPRRSDIT